MGEVGTFVLPELRGRGIGKALTKATLAFVRQEDYQKLVVYVRAANHRAQAFCRNPGFSAVGVLTRQVKIGRHYDDEIVMEMFLRESSHEESSRVLSCAPSH